MVYARQGDDSPAPFAALESECAKEPIHIPGLIQQFGCLLAIDEATEAVQFASQNIPDYFPGVSASALIGHSWKPLFADAASTVESYIASPYVSEEAPLQIQREGKAWHLSAHRKNSLLILEIESSTLRDLRRPGQIFHRRVKNAIQRLQKTSSLLDLCQVAAEEVRDITGFGRVLVYRFDHEYNGQVVAESLTPGEDSYLGNHFPASDIPPQARAVFLENWIRMIPDVGYEPVGILPEAGAGRARPLDLSCTSLRSVSPIHVEYLKNMNVSATLTISLKDEEKLWGLIACHDRLPHYVDPDDRLACQLIGQLVSSQIRVKEERADLEHREHLKSVHAKLLQQMESEPDFVKGLIQYDPNLIAIADAEGAAAAIYFEGDWVLVGKTPTVSQIEELVTYLRQAQPNTDVFVTDCLPKLHPPAREYREIASGLLAVTIPKTERNYLLWFRPEVISQITWAGNPKKAVETQKTSVRLHPRKSFEAWKETVTERSLPWKRAEIEAVENLRNSILAIDLRRQFEKEQIARATAERLSREKEDMLGIVSHDLKNPLGSVKLSLGLLKKAMAKSDSKGHGIVLEKTQAAVTTMEKLIHDMLDIGKIEAGTFTLDLENCDVGSVISQIEDLLSPIAQDKQIELITKYPASPIFARCDRERVLQVLSNLVGNALKFVGSGGQVEVGVRLVGEEIEIYVRDTGPGIPTEHLERIFNRFWQDEKARKMGSGLGLFISRTIIESHGGRIWAESELGRGSTFFFRLPGT